MNNENQNMSFWQHLDVLRATLLRIIIAVVILAIAAFCFKDQIFSFILAPRQATFPTYRLISYITTLTSSSPLLPSQAEIPLINTEMARQFIIHLQASLWVALLCASPYILIEIFRFISPALYKAERRHALRLSLTGYLMFMLGAALSYLLIFPLTFRFLSTYQVAAEVSNLITLESYIDTLTTLTLLMGVMFELPVIGWLMARMGLINATLMRHYRRHAVVLILIAAAIITPTADALTLTLVALPVTLLYEATILIISRTKK